MLVASGSEVRSSVARKLSAVREYFKFLYSEKEIKDNPAANVLSPKKEKSLPKFLTEEEIRQLIEAAKAHPDFRHKRTAVMLVELASQRASTQRLVLILVVPKKH